MNHYLMRERAVFTRARARHVSLDCKYRIASLVARAQNRKCSPEDSLNEKKVKMLICPLNERWRSPFNATV